MLENSLPELRGVADLGNFCIQINGYNIKIPSSARADIKPVYQYDFIGNERGVIAEPDCTGEVTPIWDSVTLPVKEQEPSFPTWVIDWNLRVWPKSDLSMNAGKWHSENDIKENILRLYQNDMEKFKDFPDYYSPQEETDIEVFNINERLWGHVVSGNFEQSDMFFTGLTDHLVMIFHFDASACWHRNGFAPPDVKAHIMTFFMDYLQHVQVVEIGSVPDDQLPPLGFYPAEREEKEIDADGKTIDKEPEIEERYDPLGW